MHQRKPNDRELTRVRDKPITMPVAMAQHPKGKAVTEIMMQLKVTIRPGGGQIKTKSNALTTRDGGICDTTAPVLEMSDL